MHNRTAFAAQLHSTPCTGPKHTDSSRYAETALAFVATACNSQPTSISTKRFHFALYAARAQTDAHVPNILKGMYQERACPNNFEGHVPRAGLSQEFQGHVPKEGLSQDLRRACPESGHVSSILKGLSQERACPRYFKRHVPRTGLSQVF